MRIVFQLSAAALVTIALWSETAFPQTLEKPSFEAAYIQASPSTTRFQFFGRPQIRLGRYEIRTATMVDMVAWAYTVFGDFVVGGPHWVEWDRYDIYAQVPAGSTPDSQKDMLKELLADRFKLVARTEMRPMAALRLTAGKHLQVKEAAPGNESQCKFNAGNGPIMLAPRADGGPPQLPAFTYTCQNMTMEKFAVELRDMGDTGKVVVDQTGLKGAYDFTIKIQLQIRIQGVQTESTSFSDTIEKQLGLKLEPIKIALPVIVIDSVNEAPSANPPGVAELLRIGAVATEFDVADLKPTSPDFKGRRTQFQPGGRVNMQGAPLKNLIMQAWGMTDPDYVIGAPKFTEDDRYDLIAKVPPEFATNLNPDTMGPMLQALLKERFKLVVHLEERPMSAFTLRAIKPKLAKADPNSRTKFTEGPANGAKDPRNNNPAMSRLVACQNMTMAQFAEKLNNIAAGYIRNGNVLDATGLEGGYDFTLNFSPAGMLQGQGRGGTAFAIDGSQAPLAAGLGDLSDPTGGMTLFEAIEKQLGLKLEQTKRPASVVVIDHIERKPDEN